MRPDIVVANLHAATSAAPCHTGILKSSSGVLTDTAHVTDLSDVCLTCSRGAAAAGKHPPYPSCGNPQGPLSIPSCFADCQEDGLGAL